MSEDGKEVPSDHEEWGERQQDHWRALLAQNAIGVLGPEKVEEIIPKFDPEKEYSEKENVKWTREAMEGLLSIDPEDRIDILTGCTHRLPDEYLQDLMEVWDRTHDLDELHSYWKERFLRNLDRWFGNLDDRHLRFIRENDWGEAGRKEGNVILATKMPSSAREYFETDDPVERRYLYCHCPRIRSAVREGGDKLLANFCYCGAGFYKHNWERVTGKRVKVELVSSVLGGDDRCQFRITIMDNE